MTPSNFLKQLKLIRTDGEGFFRDVPLSLSMFRTATGAVAGAIGGGAFGMKAVETNGLALAWNATDVTEVFLEITVPDDYDQDADTLYLQVLAQMGGATDTPALTADAFLKRAGEALAADLAPANSAALGDDAAWVTIDLSGNSLQGGDVVQVFVTPAAHGTDAIHAYGARVRYKSDLVAYDNDNRA